MSENEKLPSSPGDSSGHPSWLTASLIESVLNQGSVTELKVEHAVSAGENYATVVYRAHAVTQNGPTSLIIKCVPENEFRAKLIAESEFMSKEVRMYRKTLPMLRGTHNYPNFPTPYQIPQEHENDALILPDMGTQGYRTRQRHLGLDFQHCRLALIELAHLHGLSAALRIQNPKEFEENILEKYKDALYLESKRDNNRAFFEATMRALSTSIHKKFPFRFHRIGKLMEKFVDTAFDDLKADVSFAHDPTRKDEIENSVIVLTHGDFWSNNMLFKYEEGSDTPTACMMIDFQISRCGSPALDLTYLIFSSTTQATRRLHLDQLLQIYLDEAHIALKSRGIENPGNKFYNSVQQIKDDFNRFSNFGFLFSCILLPIVIADKTAAPDFDKSTSDNFMENNESPFAKMYSGSLFVERFAELLEDFDDMGYFLKRQKQFIN